MCFSLFQNNPKDLGQTCKVYLDLSVCLEKNSDLITKELRYHISAPDKKG